MIQWPEKKYNPLDLGNTPNGEFVTVKDKQFYCGGQPYRFAGTNAYYLPNYEAWISAMFVTKTLHEFQKTGIRTIRMWGFYDGQPQYKNDTTIQPEPGVYNEKGLKGLDRTIKKCKERGIKVILPFINNWKDLGGIPQYCVWAGVYDSMKDAHTSYATNHFIKGDHSDQMQGWFKDYIAMLLNRTNTETGVKYKDEPAIFSWEIGNEIAAYKQDKSLLTNWYKEISEYIKSIDSNHMVSTGEQGADMGVPSMYHKNEYSNQYILRAKNISSSFIDNTQLDSIDYGTGHWYPSSFGWRVSDWKNEKKNKNLLKAQHAWIKDHVVIAKHFGKPFVIGEWGYPGWGDERVKNIYSDFYRTCLDYNPDGTLLWEYVTDYRKGSEYGGNIQYPAGRKDEKLYNDFKNYISNVSGGGEQITFDTDIDSVDHLDPIKLHSPVKPQPLKNAREGKTAQEIAEKPYDGTTKHFTPWKWAKRVFTSRTAKNIYHYLPFISRIIERFTPVNITPIAEITALIAGGGSYIGITQTSTTMFLSIILPIITFVVGSLLSWAIKHVKDKDEHNEFVEHVLDRIEEVNDEVKKANDPDSHGGRGITKREQEHIFNTVQAKVFALLKSLANKYI
jgi:mannan endo-1,4-beta-mannosidase